MSGIWQSAQHEKTARCGSLLLSAASGADRPASLPARDRRGARNPAARDDCGPIASVIGSVVCRTVSRLIADTRDLAGG